jgi:hypothetical protein
MRYNHEELLPLRAFKTIGKRLTTLEGSGGGDAPEPDPQIGKAALETAKLGRDAFNFYKQEYIDNKPNQDRLNELSQQVQEQLIEAGEFNNLASKDYYNYMQETFRPLEKSIVKDAEDYDTAGRREAEAGKGLSDVRQSFDTTREMALRAKERTGVNPNSGNAMALNEQMDTSEAIAGADAMNKGRTRAEMTGKAMKMDAASLGRNLPSNQATSQQIANQSATAGLNAGLAGAANDRAGLSVYGAGVDAATRGLSTSANILQNQYNGQLQAYQANQASNDSAWSNIGSLVGTGAMLMAASDENIKKDVKDVDDEAALEGVEKTEVKQWKYDDRKVAGLDTVQHTGAMAQDLKANFGSQVSDGKQVDLISAVGVNMAATKALSKKVDKLLKKKGYKNGGKVGGVGLESASAGGNVIDNETGEVFEDDGHVQGAGTNTSDSINSRLSDNEYVMNAGVTEMLGVEALDAINQRGLEFRGSK